MDNSFSIFLDTFLEAWKTSSLIDLKAFISKEYQGREISQSEILDFAYDESMNGWEEGFKFARENNACWNIKVVSILPLREDETMAILSATLVIEGKSLNNANLFFYTFKKLNTDWKLVRSYIEAGVTSL